MSVEVDAKVKVPPAGIVSVGLFVASDATANTFFMIMLHPSMVRSPDMVTFPSQVNVLVYPSAIEPSYPSAASVLVNR